MILVVDADSSAYADVNSSAADFVASPDVLPDVAAVVALAAVVAADLVVDAGVDVVDADVVADADVVVFPDRQNTIHNCLFLPNIPGDICDLLPREPPASLLLPTL